MSVDTVFLGIPLLKIQYDIKNDTIIASVKTRHWKQWSCHSYLWHIGSHLPTPFLCSRVHNVPRSNENLIIDALYWRRNIFKIGNSHSISNNAFHHQRQQPFIPNVVKLTEGCGTLSVSLSPGQWGGITKTPQNARLYGATLATYLWKSSVVESG